MSPLSLETPTIRVPGLLTDDALQEQLKTFKQNFNGGATQAPTAAYDMADKVQADFFDAPVRNTLRAASALTPLPLSTPMRLAADAMSSGPAQPSPQQKAIDVRSDILSNDSVKGISSYLLGGPLGYLAREGGALDAAGTLTPEESDAAQADRQKDAGAYEAAVKRTVETRAKLRGLTDEEATAMGLPLQPGMDAQSEQEQRQVLAQQDADRIKNAEAKTAEAKVEKPTQTWWLNAIRSFYTGQNSMYTGIGKGAAIGLWELPGEMAGIREAGRSDLRAWFDTVDATMKKVLPPDHAQAGDFVNQLSQGAGSMVGFMVGGYLASELGLPAKASTMLVGATSGGDQQYEDAEKFKAGGVQRLISYLAGAGLGMTEATPINRALARLETATGGVVSRALQTTGAPALEEFIQELGQNLGQDVVAKAIYDEQRKLDWKSYLQAAAVGGVLGGLGGSAAETLARSGVSNAPHGTDEKQPAAKAADDGAQTDFLHTLMNDAQVNFDDLTAEPVDAPVEGDLGPAEYVRVDDNAAPTGAPVAADAAPTEVQATPSPVGDTAAKSPGDGETWTVADAASWYEANRAELDAADNVEQNAPSNVVAVPLVVAEAFEPDRAKDVTATPEFNAWFGDSQVKTEDGPKVVYHGTARGGFEQFDTYASNYGLMGQGAYFTEDPNVASEYTDKGAAKIKRQGGEPSPAVYPVFLSVKNAVDMEAAADTSAWEKAYPNYLGGLDNNGDPKSYEGFTNEQMYREVEEGITEEGDVPVYEGAEIMQDGLRSMGFDGITHVGGGRVDPNGVKHRVWIAFEPEQIKSVFNSGRFDPNSPDLLAQRRSSVLNLDGEELMTFAQRAPKSEAFNNWFGDSKVADAAGKPLVVYHGSRSDIAQFERSKTGEFGAGIYFSEFPEVASGYAADATGEAGRNITPVYLTLKNPLVTSDKNLPRGAGVKKLQAQGYDGVIGIGANGERQFVAFNPTQIKSVNNAGNFDPGNPDILAQRAYHGTPHKFEQFSLDHLGTGEGAQAFGWGLYFAENRKIAESYRNILSAGRTDFREGGKDVPLDDKVRQAIDYVTRKPTTVKELLNGMIETGVELHNELSFWAKYQKEVESQSTTDERFHEIKRKAGLDRLASREKAAADIQEQIDKYQELLENNEAATDTLRQYPDGAFEPTEGRLFTVDLPEDSELLVYDDKLNDQPDKVKEIIKAVASVYAETAPASTSKFDDAQLWKDIAAGRSDLTGEAFYNLLAEDTGDKTASEILRDWGIPGHKFLDGSSRNKGKGSYNFVIYDDAAVNVENYASRVLAATSSNRGGYAAEQQRAQAGIAGQPAAGTDNIGLRQIADNFTKLLGITVRQGRFTLKGAEGQFSAKSGVVRLKSPNDLSTLIHEGAHTLEVNATGPLRAFVNANKTVFQTAARKLYGGDVEKMGVAERVSEGFAEFFRVYTLNRRYAEINYPQLTQDFDAFFAQHDPKLRNGLQLIGDQYAAWLQLPSSSLVRNMVVSGKQTTGINAAIEEARKQGVGNWFREFANRIFSGAINRNNDLNNLVADILNVAQENRGTALDLKRADDPRVLIRMATNAGNRAMVQITDGVMPHRSTDPTTAGLRAVLLRYHGKGADENLSVINEERQRDFAAYTVSLRGIDEYSRFAQGLIERPPLAATLGDLQTTVKEMEAKYGADFIEAARMVHEYSMGLWEKGYQAGLIDEDTYNEGQTRSFYVPLQRDLSDKEITQSGISASAARAGRSIVKRFRGSDRDIIDPMDALMQKTFSLEKVIAENEVKKALAKLADQAGQVGALVERVPAHRLMGQQFSIQEVARQLTKDPSVSATDAQDLLTILETAIDEGNRIALFRSQQAVAGGENIVFFWENGKLAALQVKDGDVGTDIINTLNAVGTETVPLLVDLISYPSAAFRSAVTSWPDFLLVNFIRDQMSAFVLTEGYKPFVTGLRGVSDEIRQGDWARQYNAAMGTMGGMNTSTLHQARVNVDIAALRKKGYIARVFGEDGIKGKIGGLARLTELTETGTRLGIYRTAYDRAKADGLTDWEASVEAGYIATDYIDFGLHGNRMLAWRRLVPFLNAQLQGLYKMMRTLGGDEVRQRRGLRFALSAFFKDINGLELSRTEQQAIRVGRKAWLKMASLGIIGAALQAVFKDDPDYQDASEYLRTTGWIIPIGNGEIFYIPKPFELAMVSNIVERGMEMASGDKEAKWRMMRGMAMNLSPPTNPPAIQAIVEQAANWDSFSGREIVPDYMRALEPELQYNHYTTQFAKRLGSMFGWSPMRIDHVMSAFGASAYRDLTQLYNMTDPSRPASDKTDWPITRRFVRDARRGAVSAQDFWKFASTVDGSLRRAELTYKNYIEAGRDNAAQSYLSTLDPDERAYALLNTHFKADFKRLNPTYRARQLTTIVSAMRRELYSDLGVENSGPGGATDPFMLSAKEKADVDTLLSEYARREVRNSLVFMKAPGWANKKPLPTEPTIEMMRATQPLVAEEFERRIKKAKVYNAETVQEYWPEVRDRLLSDGSDAFLKDIQTIAKVMR